MTWLLIVASSSTEKIFFWVDDDDEEDEEWKNENKSLSASKEGFSVVPDVAPRFEMNLSEMARNKRTANIMENINRRMRIVEKSAKFIDIVISLFRILYELRDDKSLLSLSNRFGGR